MTGLRWHCCGCIVSCGSAGPMGDSSAASANCKWAQLHCAQHKRASAVAMAWHICMRRSSGPHVTTVFMLGGEARPSAFLQLMHSHLPSCSTYHLERPNNLLKACRQVRYLLCAAHLRSLHAHTQQSMAHWCHRFAYKHDRTCQHTCRLTARDVGAATENCHLFCEAACLLPNCWR